MKYYAINGNNIAIADKVSTLKRYYQNVQKLPDDYYERCYVVQNGELVIDEEAEKQKAITNLDSQYNSDKAVLMSQYTEANIDGDEELKESIKAELVALREQYDSNYEEIVGGE